MDIGTRILALSIGGALGVNARYWLAAGIDRWAGPRWPWATFAINVSGSFAIGVAATLLARRDPHSTARLVVITGFLGGYTTFSTFAFEARALWARGQGASALGYALGSVLAGALAVALGIAAARGLASSGPGHPATGGDVEGERPRGPQ